jgi:hypothetical protein
MAETTMPSDIAGFPADAKPANINQTNGSDGSEKEGSVSPDQDSPHTAHVPNENLATPSPAADDEQQQVLDAPHELAEVFRAHSGKLYFSGFVYQRKDLDSNGRRVQLAEGESQWTAWWVELRGSVLQFWSAEDQSLDDLSSIIPSPERVTALKNRQLLPNYINIADACMGVVRDGPSNSGHSPTMATTPNSAITPNSAVTTNSDARTLTPTTATPRRQLDGPSNPNFCHLFNLTSAGSNLYTICCPTIHLRDGWLFAIRLSQFEFVRLCEVFTARLVRQPSAEGPSFADMGVDSTTFEVTSAKKAGEVVHQGWVLARVTYETEWRR